MNERIRQLAEQARIKDHWSIDEARYLTNYLNEQKFAELIVAECCQVLSKETIRHDGYGYNQHALYQKIREHFGVQE